MKKSIFIYFALFLVSCSNATPVEKTTKNVKEKPLIEIKETVTETETVKSDSLSERASIDSKMNEETTTIPVEKNQPKEEIEVKETPEIQAENFHDYIQWNGFLTQHVSSSGKVNYSKIKADKKQLEAIISMFEKNYPTSSWSSKQKLAYWINAYNLYTLKLVSDHYPISSITKITAKPWDKKFIVLGGETLSLNDIEHKKIRAKNNEPRIHFALNCASESCPILYNKAFTAKNLSYQLTKQTKRFLADKSKNDFSDPKNIKISSIFDWYKGDFEKKEGSVVAFINKYRTEQLVDPNITYLEYLWGLNE